ncbi:hypothetical protein [uncultured Pseudomonas sp.]|uniref:hypothetical protein n=1 Tax=uncultured Pseudomonas sp. TaxID=114707 RepID=UPI0025D9DAA0|nr:hypothetical protein [uncultured Pseudomonas sp.]
MGRLQHGIDECYRGDIDEAVTRHLELMLGHYRRKPFFYKSLMKYDRLMVVMALLCFHFRDPLTPLSRVKEFCEQRGYLSRNSLESYFSFFIITGYMHVWTHPEDARLRLYRPTRTALEEAVNVTRAYLLPAQLLRPNAPTLDLENPQPWLRDYFVRLGQLLEADLMLDSLLPGAKWIMNKDGGHLPMLALHLDALAHRSVGGGYKVSTYAELSARLCVSKTHLMRLVREGEQKGYFRCVGTLVEMRPAFAELVRHTMAINFAVAQVSMELCVDAQESRIAQPDAQCLG